MSRYFPSGDEDDEKDDKTFTLPGSKTDFRDMRDKHTDVVFEGGLSNKTGLDAEPLTPKKFEAHRLILSRHSKVFEAMLYGPFSEGKVESIRLEHDAEAFSCLLNYMYGEKNTGLTLDVFLIVYELSNRYQVEELKKICHGILKKSITNTTRVGNAYQIYCAVKNFDAELERSCLYKMFDNLSDLVKENDIDQKVFYELIVIMKDRYSYTDGYIYRAMLVWKEKNTEYDKDLWQKTLSLLEINGFNVEELMSDKSLRVIFGAEAILDVISKRYNEVPKIGSKVSSSSIGDMTVESITFEGGRLSINGKRYRHYEYDERGFF